MDKSFTRIVALTLATSLVLATVPVAPVHAAMVGTSDVISHEQGMSDRARINALLDRDDVREGLLAHGVSLVEAQARVAALSNEEARLMAERLDQLPAGAANALGILFSIFIILLVTDLLGLTNVFPFTRN